jgi:geranylgeranyl diphosphate synthase type II
MASTTAAEFLDFATQMRSQVDAALTLSTDYADRCPPRLAEAIRYSLLAPGKRLRPVLVLLAAEACGCESAAALPAACAVEMIHAYSLIHDDLPAMDDDDLRRGRPTCHVQFDEATAILAGDALLTQAFEVLAAAKWPANVTVRCCKELAQAAGYAGMVGGQADDLAAEERDDGDLDDLQSIHRRKTGAMIRVSLRLGAIVAQATSQQLNAVTAYGEKLGLAFQIVDDLLDFRGDVQTLGKRTQKDAGRGKLTFPGLLGVEEATARAESLIAAACDDVAMFGPKASRLESLARYVIERNH